MTVRYKSATVAEFLENHSYDVSRGGLFIKTASPFPPGTLLKFEVRIAEEQKVMMGVGRVTWKRDTNLGPEKPAGMGVKFIKLEDESAGLINQLVASREGAEASFEEGARESGVSVSAPPPALETDKATTSGISSVSRTDPDKSVIAHTAELLRSALDATGSRSAPSEPPRDSTADDPSERNTLPTSIPSSKPTATPATVSTPPAVKSSALSTPPASKSGGLAPSSSSAAESKAASPSIKPEKSPEAAAELSQAVENKPAKLETPKPSDALAITSPEVKSPASSERKPADSKGGKGPASKGGSKPASKSSAPSSKTSSKAPAAAKTTTSAAKPGSAATAISSQVTTPPRRSQEAEPQGGVNPIMWVLLLGVVIAVGYFLVTQNRGTEEPSPEPQAETPKAQEPTPVVKEEPQKAQPSAAPTPEVVEPVAAPTVATAAPSAEVEEAAPTASATPEPVKPRPRGPLPRPKPRPPAAGPTEASPPASPPPSPAPEQPPAAPPAQPAPPPASPPPATPPPATPPPAQPAPGGTG